MSKISRWFNQSKLHVLIQKKYFSVIVFTIYNLLLNFSYIFILSPGFGSEGFTFKFQFLVWLFVSLLCILVYYSVSENDGRLSSMFVEVLMWMYYAPMACFYSLSGNKIKFFIYISICFVIIRFLLNINYGYILNKIKINKAIELINKNHAIVIKLLKFSCVLICLSISCISVWGLYKFFDMHNWFVALNVFRVYEIRSQQSITGILAYVFTWQTKVINIFLFSYLINKKKYLLMLIPLVIQVAFYLSLGNKTDLFTIGLCFAIFITMKTKFPAQVFGCLFPIGTLFVSIAPMISAKGILLYTFFRRTFFTQAALSNIYFNFFSQHNLLLFSEGRLGRMLGIPYPYPTYSAKLVMANHMGSMSGGANGSFLASAFANLDFAGMIIVCVMLSGILLLLDYFCRKLPLSFSLTFLVPGIFALMSTEFFTTLGTHGFLLSIMLIMLYGSTFLISPKEGTDHI